MPTHSKGISDMMRFLTCFLLFLTMLAPLAQTSTLKPYDSHGKRDPFTPLIGTHAKITGSLDDVMSIDDIDLQGIAGDSKGNKVAIINREMIKEGQTVGRVTIKKITGSTVVLLIDEEEYKINMYEDKL